MVGEIVPQIEEIIIAKEVVPDPLVEIVQVHHQTEVKEDHTNALETIVHFLEEKGELSRNHQSTYSLLTSKLLKNNFLKQ